MLSTPPPVYCDGCSLNVITVVTGDFAGSVILPIAPKSSLEATELTESDGDALGVWDGLLFDNDNIEFTVESTPPRVTLGAASLSGTSVVDAPFANLKFNRKSAGTISTACDAVKVA
jgi:hypothetical protein